MSTYGGVAPPILEYNFFVFVPIVTLISIMSGKNDIRIYADESSVTDDVTDLDKVPEVSRERVCNDLVNTSVTAALVGGFAFTNLQSSGTVSPDGLAVAIYLMSVIAIHCCTCSCLMGVLLYQKANGLHDKDVTSWTKQNKLLLSIPMMKFTVGKKA